MECHDVQRLLAFAKRRAEELDAPERELLQQHLDACPDCSALAQAERHEDETLGQVMRDVPVPAALKQQLLKRLATERGSGSWKWALAAAVLLLAVAGGLWYNSTLPQDVTVADVENVLRPDLLIGRNDAAEFFKKRGVSVSVLEEFDFTFLRGVDVVEVRGRRVAKLSFVRGKDRADVLVLPHGQFHVKKQEFPPSILICPEGNFDLVVSVRGELNRLKKQRPDLS